MRAILSLDGGTARALEREREREREREEGKAHTCESHNWLVYLEAATLQSLVHCLA